MASTAGAGRPTPKGCSTTASRAAVPPIRADISPTAPRRPLRLLHGHEEVEQHWQQMQR